MALDNPNNSEEDCGADIESDSERENGIKDLEHPEKQDVSATPNVPRLIWPTQKSKRQAEMVLVTVSTMGDRRNNRIKKHVTGVFRLR